ncbi:lipase family protein [Kordia sp.]|uniref:lipase family protein n=1 Tax=Kordia sp. TaxID=1965332 RepID=UPI003D6C107F
MNISETTQEEKARIIHSLSFASNSGFGKIFEDESTCQKSYEKLQNYVTAVSNKVLSDKRTQEYIGDDWETVWGPVVYSNDQNSSFARADNTMGVYFSKAQKLFVIAIAGTNSISSFGWMKEDFDVKNTKKWRSITGSGYGSISQGTATGLHILTKEMQSDGTDFFTAITKFISDKKIEETEIAVTGHSLGGALSPALALFISDKKAELGSKTAITISTYPSAGPTIGVETSFFRSSTSFIHYYEKQIKDKKIHYHGVKNDLDIVPMAWDKNDLVKIPDLYSNKKITNENFKTLALVAILNTINKDRFPPQVVYKQIQPLKSLGGTFNDPMDNKARELFNFFRENPILTDSWIPKPLQGNLKDLESLTRFFAQAAYQHVTAYDELLGITNFMKQYKEVAKEVNTNDANAPEIAANSEQMAFGLASEAVGFDINSLLELSELNDEELKKLTEEGEE